MNRTVVSGCMGEVWCGVVWCSVICYVQVQVVLNGAVAG